MYLCLNCWPVYLSVSDVLVSVSVSDVLASVSVSGVLASVSVSDVLAKCDTMYEVVTHIAVARKKEQEPVQGFGIKPQSVVYTQLSLLGAMLSIQRIINSLQETLNSTQCSVEPIKRSFKLHSVST